MTKIKLTLVASVLLGGFAFAGPISAAPMSPNGLQAAPSSITQVRMTRNERMMMKKRMMRKKMMRKRMMNRM